MNCSHHACTHDGYDKPLPADKLTPATYLIRGMPQGDMYRCSKHKEAFYRLHQAVLRVESKNKDKTTFKPDQVSIVCLSTDNNSRA